jgi:hypothetical protein
MLEQSSEEDQMRKTNKTVVYLFGMVSLLLLMLPAPAWADHGYIVNRVCGNSPAYPDWARNRMESVSWYDSVGGSFPKYAESIHFLDGQEVDRVQSGWIDNWRAVAFHYHDWIRPGAEVQGWHGFRAHGTEYWKWGWADGCIIS